MASLDQLTAARVVEDLDGFDPSALSGSFSVCYPGDDGAFSPGAELPAAQTHVPLSSVRYIAEGNESKKYTLIMTDPDAPDRAEHAFREFVHYVISDLTAESLAAGGTLDGTTVLDYLGVGAPCKSKLHRYVFLLFEQPEGSAPAALAAAFEGRGGKKVCVAAKSVGLGPVVAATYFESQWDACIDAVHIAMGWLPPPQFRSPSQEKLAATPAADALTQLKEFSTVVADTADFTLIAKYRVQDTTTNPQIVLRAARDPQFAPLVADAVVAGRAADSSSSLRVAFEKLFVNFGVEILKIVPGRVSTEVDARLSFDEAETVATARRLIALYEAAGVDRSRVLIKVAATWEGIAAARTLEAEGIHINATLVFGFHQAVLCAQAGVTLISPFVARVTDFACGGTRTRPADGSQDGALSAGVIAVAKSYNYLRKHGYATVVMPASLRTVEEVFALAGIDLYTMPPSLLDKLAASNAVVERQLSPERAAAIPDADLPKVEDFTQQSFRFTHNEDECCVKKLSQGIRDFSVAARELEALLLPLLAEE